MKKGQAIRSRQLERKTINLRAKIAAAFMFLCFCGVGYKAYVLQVADHAKYKEIANKNTIKVLSTSPERGDIVDRNGKVIASTRPMYDLVVIPERLAAYRKNRSKAVQDYVDMLSKFLPMQDGEKSLIRSKILKSHSYEKVIIVRDLSQSSLSTALENIGYLEGTSVQVKKVRFYPYKGAFLSPLGYVGRVGPDDISRSELEGYELIRSDYVGKMGIEKTFDHALYGQIGKETVALNANGDVIERKISSRPTKGETVQLTLDADLQIEAYELMQGKKGAIVIQDIENGDLLTALSMPEVDPNTFLNAMTQKEVDSLYSNLRPLFNRVARGQYPPASVIKPFISLVALEGGFIDADSIRWSGPFFELGGHRFRDWKRQGHGNVNLAEAIAVSSDVYFYRLAHLMGIDYIHDSLSEFGFGKRTGVMVDGESAGLLPSSEWKMRVKKEPWFGGETLTVGIGQGFMMTTPIQIANAMTALINGGVLYSPNLIKGAGGAVLNRLDLNPLHVDSVKEGMVDVVYSKRGTGRGIASIAEIPMAGKTGTSQVFSTLGKIDYDNEDIAEHLRDHAVWVGYAPIELPKVVIMVFVENGGSGSSAAAPIAQKLANLYAKKYLHSSSENTAKAGK